MRRCRQWLRHNHSAFRSIIKRSRTIFTNQNSWSRSQTLLQATCMWLPLVAAAWWLVCNPRGRQRKKSRTPHGEISWNQVEIMRNKSRFPWNQARKSAQPSSPTHFYNIWRLFEGNHGEIKEKSGNVVRQNCSLPTPRCNP